MLKLKRVGETLVRVLAFQVVMSGWFGRGTFINKGVLH
jgi:hypothetical protein